MESTNVSCINSTSEVPPEQLDTMDDPAAVDTEGELSRATRDTSGKISFLIHSREEHAAEDSELISNLICSRGVFGAITCKNKM